MEQKYQDYEVGIEKGRSSTKNYQYWIHGVNLKSKTMILRALNLEFNVMRTDKITKQTETFDHKIKQWRQ